MIKTKYFGKATGVLPRPYLLSTQKDSWDHFWDTDLKELFAEISPIHDYTGEKLEIWFEDYKLGEPNYSSDSEAKENNDSYEAPLRVKIRLVNLKTKEVKEQEVFLTDFPLMTEKGTFIVNGVERVIISQIIRSPGAFFTAKEIRGAKHFGGKIIPNRGAWLEFETDRMGMIGAKINRKRRVSSTTLLRALGYETNEQIQELFKDVDVGEKRYITETLKKDITHNKEEALMEVYQRLRPGDRATAETARELFESMFFDFKRYDFSKVGRWRVRQRLAERNDEKNQEITVEDRILNPADVVAVMREIIRLNNNPDAKPDQIDHLGNRRLRTISELLKNRLRIGLMRMERIIKDRMSTLDIATMTPVQIINPRPFMAAVKQFFSSFQLSQFMDSENPLSELEHKRRISATGPGGLTRERAGFEVRDVQPSHYGRICPIETPEGPNIGLVGHLAGFSKVNDYGFLETPYFKVKNGKISSEIQYLNAYEEERYNIAMGSTVRDSAGNILSKTARGRIKSKPGIIEKSKIDFIDVSPEQPISLATSCIPFLQNDDANRALMGSNMQRQAVPLVNPQVPLVMTGSEERVARDSGQEILAKADGIVTAVDATRIEIKETVTKKTREYKLQTFVKTNQYTCFHQKPLVQKGQKVKAGDILSTGGAISQGRLALGRNLLVAFMSWRGGSFEDAVILSERLAKDDAYTTIHLETFSCDVRETKLGPEVTTSDIPNVSEEKLNNLDEEGIIRVGAEVETNAVLVGKISPKGKEELTPEERLLKAIFGDKAKDVKDTSLLMQHGKRGRVIGVKVFSREEGHKLDAGIIKRVEIKIAELRKIQTGDKLCGRHGNKGIISMILPEEEMPFMKDGTPVDIILNPLSVASRMNLGQILETHLGWAAHELGYHAITPSLSGAKEEDIKAELKKAGLPESGKINLYDGKTGQMFSNKITVGYIYMLKLIHMVADKMHMRSIGPYSLITQQPLGGKAQFGGQRFGEMEVWALEGYGAAHTLQEMLTIKSDDIPGRASTYESILKGQPIREPNLPASFNLLVNELKALGLNVEVKERPTANSEEE
ncbi:MAG: DNA-directed RNA polymerase subunit beta [Patescibacteria group bacterium]